MPHDPKVLEAVAGMIEGLCGLIRPEAEHVATATLDAIEAAGCVVAARERLAVFYAHGVRQGITVSVAMEWGDDPEIPTDKALGTALAELQAARPGAQP